VDYLPYNLNLKARARELRKRMTPAERKIWYEFLRYYPLTISRQKPIDNYILDFYCPKLKLAIEIDGDTHYTKEGIVNDKKRTKILESYNIKVLRFTNTEVLNNFEGVCEVIKREVESTKPPDPL
jgi:very-short-patch-repair endonuclease